MDAVFALAVEFYQGFLRRILLKPDELEFNIQSNLGPALFDTGFVNISSCVFWGEH